MKVQKTNVQQIVELSGIQKGMLFSYLKATGSNQYNVQISLNIKGDMDVDKFGKALGQLQQANEALRSVFNWELSKPVQIILKQTELDFEFQDISEHANLDKDISKQDWEQRFDLSSVPFKVRLFKKGISCYTLVITCHHILYDGWSNGILLEELFSYYAALLKGEASAPRNKMSLSQVRTANQFSTLTERKEHWQAYMHAFEPSATMGRKHPEKHEGLFRCKQFSYSKSKLETWASTHKITVAAALYAAYAILLKKISGRDDVAFGTTVSNRDTTVVGVDQVLDNFINTIPLRIDGSEENLIGQARKISKQLMEREKFKGTAYQEIKEWLGLQPSSDLFDSVMVIENYPIDQGRLEAYGDIRIALNYVREKTDIPLLLNVLFGEELEFQFAYYTNLVDPLMVEALPKYLERILDVLVDYPETPISAVELLSKSEKNRLLKEFNDTEQSYPAEKSITQVFDEQVAKAPDHVALRVNGKQISYQEVHEKSTKIACYLQQQGVATGDLVGIMLEREELLIPAIYGILKSGAAYVPIDPDYPTNRINKIIQAAGIRVLVTREALLSSKVEVKTVVDLSNDWDKIESTDLTKLPKGPKGSDLAYVIYTSGSTGEPKGVMIEHHSVINRILWMQSAYPIDEQDVLIQKTPVTFDVSVWELFWWSFVGASVSVLKPRGEKDPAELFQAMISDQVTTMHFVPSMLSGFLTYIEGLDDHDVSKISNLNMVFSSGEALKQQHVSQFGELLNQPFQTRLVNLYGPTEATVDVSHFECAFDAIPKSIPIGKPVSNTALYILDDNHQPCPVGVEGELMIAGVQLSRGYLNNSSLTHEKFVDHPFLSGAKIYKSGDRACWLPDGNIEYLGRKDDQVKLRGLRIELGEIEYQLQQFPWIQDAVVVVTQYNQNEALTGYYTAKHEIPEKELKKFLLNALPSYMVPSNLLLIDAIPLNPNGKLDRKALPQPFAVSKSAMKTDVSVQEEKLMEMWAMVLGHKDISPDRNFFDLGGDSIKLITLSARIKKEFGKEVSVTELFDHPTLQAMLGLIGVGTSAPETHKVFKPQQAKQDRTEIAVIGMAGRFPGATNVHEFWENLALGKEGIRREETQAKDEEKVHAKGKLEDFDAFDNAFFGYNPAEAQSMDPQIRLLHECAWETLEDSGYNPFNYEGSIGLYAGASPNPYFSVLNLSEEEGWVEQWQNLTYAHKDYLCTRVSYALNLKGPSVNLSTACSTSLVAIDEACSDLLAGKCEMALAGGVSVTLHDEEGYKYHPGMILSPDGKCRAFDDQAAGTVGGNGVGLVLLKPLDLAIADGDQIHAVIKASAKNNDGNQKIGFTAPSISGQAAVIREAIEKAQVPSETITYVETHGTGTKLGDPIEIEGLKRAFATDKQQFCAIGSVKASIGHLDAAAGIAGFIKTVLSLKYKTIPRSIHFETPNKAINFKESPFYVNQELQEWKNGLHPRRAGISSFGIGGTNAHVIVEEAPKVQKDTSERSFQIIPIAAKTHSAFANYSSRLAEFLKNQSDNSLADVAYSLQKINTNFPVRKHLVCENTKELIEGLTSFGAQNTVASERGNQPKVTFMFSGQGSPYREMCKDLYESYPEYKVFLDKGFASYQQLTGKDLKKVVFASAGDEINQTEYAQPALFIVEFALSELLASWGVTADYLIGHSLGEYTAACVAGLFSFDDGLKLVINRGQIMQKVAPGSMMSIAATKEELIPQLNHNLDLAAVNSTHACVVSGKDHDIQAFRESLEEQGYSCKILPTSHAFHSYMLEGVLAEFKEVVKQVAFHAYDTPIISNLTGRQTDFSEISNSDYWVDHLRQTVNFASGIETLLEQEEMVFIELGPGNVLTNLVRNNTHFKDSHALISTVRHARQSQHDMRFLLQSIGKIWEAGVDVNWSEYYAREVRAKISLPGYAFDRIKYPVNVESVKSPVKLARPGKNPHINEWFYVPGWSSTTLKQLIGGSSRSSAVMIFGNETSFGIELEKKLSQMAIPTLLINSAQDYRSFEVNGESFTDLEGLLAALPEGVSYDHFIYLPTEKPVSESLVEASTEYLSQLGEVLKVLYLNDRLSNVLLTVITREVNSILGTENIAPARSALASFLKVVAQEYGIATNHLDVDDSTLNQSIPSDLLTELIIHAKGGQDLGVRKKRIWTRTYNQLDMQMSSSSLKEGGKYLISGGLGNLGFLLATHLIEKYRATLLLLGRSALDAADTENEKYQRLNLLKEKGTVEYHPCDLADASQLRQVLEGFESTYGALTGAIHAAGIVDGGSIDLIQQLSPEHYKAQLKAKVAGLQSLQQVLKSHELDFGLVVSSISSMLGGLRFGAYAAANAVMDQWFTMKQEEETLRNWKLVNLDGLDFTGASKLAINPEEIVQVFERVISEEGITRVIASVSDFETRNQWLRPETDLRSEEAADVQGAGDSSEARMLQIWREFFGMPQLGQEDDFFELGGDSLKAITLLGRINNRLKTNISVADLFKYASVGALTSYISNANQGNASHSTSIPKTDLKDHYSLSSVQRRLYFLYQFDPTSTAYNMPMVLKIAGHLDVEKLERAALQLIQRHECLRTQIVLIDGEPRMKVWSEVEFEVEQLRTTEDIQSTIDDFIQPFDLEVAPLIRIGLIQSTAQEYILLVDLHHIITDAISKKILINDFVSFYKGENLDPVNLQYKDFTEWQNGEDQQKIIQAQRSFWMKEFEGEIPVLELPVDFARPLIKTNDGHSFGFSISKPQTAALNELAEKQGVTMFMLLLSIYNVLLRKLSGQEKIVIGTPIAGREHEDLESISGMFVNTLPVFIEIENEVGFDDFLKQVKVKTLESFHNQQYPYELLVDELKLERDTSRNPLFDTEFSFENFEKSTIELPDLTITTLPYGHDVAQFDLELSGFESNGQLQFNFRYATDLFEAESIKRFATYFQEIINRVLENNRISINELEIIPTIERKLLLEVFNDTEAPLDRNATYWDLFMEQVNQYPNIPAVEHHGETLTYSQLFEGAARLSSLFLKQDCEHKRVVLYMPRSIDMLVGILAAFRAGWAYIPVDNDYPIQRVRDIIEDSEAGIVFTSNGYEEQIQAIATDLPHLKETVNLDLLDMKKLEFPEDNWDRSSNDLAYIIYTSGTTGKPKGVMIRQLGMINHILAKVEDLEMTRKDVVAQSASAGFDISVWQFLTSLVIGARVVIVDKEVVMDPPQLVGELKRTSTTIYESVPSLMTAMLDDFKLNRNIEFPALRWLMPTGEPLSADLAIKWYQQFPDIKLINAYGPTECSDDITHHVVPRPESGMEPVSIGTPVRNTKIYVLNDADQLCPVGVRGEICAAGPGVGLGYWKLMEKTQTVFVPNPYAEPGYEVLYRTGDLGFIKANGEIICLGRKDDQIKIRGNRVEIGEITCQINQFPGINDAVALALEASGQKYLVAYYVANDELDESELNTFLETHLPQYMVPAHYIRLEALPTTTRGKLDKKALPKPDKKRVSYHPPVTHEEKIIAEVWSQVLGLPEVGITDSFFAIGGDSIKSIQISSRLRSKGYEVSVKDIFINQNIKALASKMTQLSPEEKNRPVTGKAKVSPIQQWFFNQKLEVPDHFNRSMLLKLHKRLSKEDLLTVMTKLTEQHDVLRSGFSPTATGWYQHIEAKSLQPEIVEIKLAEVADPNEAIINFGNTIQKSVAIDDNSLIRVGLCQGKNESWVVIVIHQLAVDGVSWRIILEDLDHLIRQQQTDEVFSLPNKSDSYLQWSVAAETYLEKEQTPKSWAYWNDILAHPYDRIPNDTIEVISEKRMDSVAIKLPKSLSRKIALEANQAYHTRADDLILSGLVQSLHECYAMDDILINIQGDARDIDIRTDISRTVGWFDVIYPILLNLDNLDKGTLIKTVKEATRDVPNSGLDFLYSVARESDISGGELVFNYLGELDLSGAEESFEVVWNLPTQEVSERNITFDWEVISWLFDDQLHVEINYNTSKFKPATLSNFLEVFEKNLADIVRHSLEIEKPVLTPSDLTFESLPASLLEDLQSRYELQDVYQLSPMQEGMLFHALSDPDSEEYFEQVRFRVAGPLDIGLMEQSIAHLIQKYDILRTIFLDDIHQVPLQLVLEHKPFEFIYKDVSSEIATSSTEEILNRYLETDKNRKFKLAQDPLIRVTVLHLSDEENWCIWSNHHIIMDGWCMSVLINEMNDAYGALKAGKKPDRKSVTSYGKYLKWLNKQDPAIALSYWQEYLAGYDKSVSLPTTGTGGISSDGVKTNTLRLSIEESKALNKVSNQLAVTLNTVIQTAWAILLARYNNTDDVVFGSVVSGRPSDIEGIENMIGLFINTIPVRIKFGDDQKITDVIREVQTEALQAESYHYQNLADVQALSGVGSGLINNLVIFENFPIENELQGYSGEERHFEISDVQVYEQTNYDLALVVIPGEELTFQFDYREGVYADWLMEQAVGHFQCIIDQIIASADFTLGEVSLGQELTISSVENHSGIADLPLEMIEQQVKKHAEAVAVVDSSSSLTYEELWHWSNKVAVYLVEKQGINKGDLVGLLMDRSPSLLIWILGILKAGAAYVPMDKNYPKERILSIQDQANLVALVTDEVFKTELKCIQTQDLWEELKGISSIEGTIRISSDDLAYVMFTSGSTGKPKGVMVSHGALSNYISWAADQYVPDGPTAFPLFTSIAFDLTVTSIYVPLTTGSQIYTYAEQSGQLTLEQILADNQIGVMKLTPSHLKVLLNTNLVSEDTQVRRLIVGGEALDSKLAEETYQLFGGKVEIFNEYGPTEATVGCMIHLFDPQEKYSSVPIGRAIPNTQVLLLDQWMQSVPKGAIGEIYITGKSLAKGYLNYINATRESFVESPFDKQGKLYKTGDLAIQMEDDNILFAGRVDEQVKIRGHRIELGEIEYHVSNYPSITHAKVLAQTDRDTRLACYYISAEPLDTGPLRAALMEHMPDYMVPSYFIHLQEFPLTTNGKLDTRALPGIEESFEKIQVTPTNQLEVDLVEIWSEILGLDPSYINTERSFFEMGGDSIRIVRLNAAIRNKLAIEMTVPELFRYPTISALAGHILSGGQGVDTTEISNEVAGMEDMLGLIND